MEKYIDTENEDISWENNYEIQKKYINGNEEEYFEIKKYWRKISKNEAKMINFCNPKPLIKEE